MAVKHINEPTSYITPRSPLVKELWHKKENLLYRIAKIAWALIVGNVQTFFHNFSAKPANTFVIRFLPPNTGWEKKASRVPYRAPPDSRGKSSLKMIMNALPITLPVLLIAMKISCTLHGSPSPSYATCYKVDQFFENLIYYGQLPVLLGAMDHFRKSSPSETSLLGRVVGAIKSQKQTVIGMSLISGIYTLFSSAPPITPLIEKSPLPLSRPSIPPRPSLPSADPVTSWARALTPVVYFLSGAAIWSLRSAVF